MLLVWCIYRWSSHVSRTGDGNRQLLTIDILSPIYHAVKIRMQRPPLRHRGQRLTAAEQRSQTHWWPHSVKAMQLGLSRQTTQLPSSRCSSAAAAAVPVLLDTGALGWPSSRSAACAALSALSRSICRLHTMKHFKGKHALARCNSSLALEKLADHLSP